MAQLFPIPVEHYSWYTMVETAINEHQCAARVWERYVHWCLQHCVTLYSDIQMLVTLSDLEKFYDSPSPEIIAGYINSGRPVSQFEASLQELLTFATGHISYCNHLIMSIYHLDTWILTELDYGLRDRILSEMSKKFLDVCNTGKV